MLVNRMRYLITGRGLRGGVAVKQSRGRAG